MKSAILLGALAAVAVSLVPQATAREHAAKTARTVVRPDPAAMRRVLAGISHHRDETWRWQRVMHVHKTPYSNSARVASEPRVPQVGAAALAAARSQGEADGAEPASQEPVALHPRLRRLVDRPELSLLRRAADGSSSSRRPTAATCCARRAPPTTGRRSSRCGSRSGRTGLAVFSHGRTRPGTVACSSHRG